MTSLLANNRRAAFLITLASAALGRAGLVGCVGPPPKPQPFMSCKPWDCGENNPTLGQNIVFHELDWTGTMANSAQVKYVSFHQGQDDLRLHVTDDQLEGITDTGLTRTGAMLIGAVITV